MDTRTPVKSTEDFSDWEVIEEENSDWHDISTSNADDNAAEPIELDDLSDAAEKNSAEEKNPAKEKPTSRKITTATAATVLSALGMPIFIKLAYDFGERLNVIFGLNKDAKSLPATFSAAAGFSGFIFNVDSWYACFDRLYATIDELKECNNLTEVKTLLVKILPKNIFTSGAGFVSSIPILDRTYKTFEPVLGTAATSFLVAMTATLYVGFGNNYMTRFLDDIEWCIKITKDPIFKKREEIIFFLNKLSPLLSKNNISLSELEYILDECADQSLEEKIKVLASVLRLHNESFSSLDVLSKESLINCASFLFGSLRAGIFLSDTKAGIEGALGIDNSIISTLLMTISLLPNIASQGNNMCATTHALRQLSSCKDITMADFSIGAIGILAAGSMTEFAFSAALGNWTIPLALITALGSLASNTRGMSQLKNRFFKPTPHHPVFSPEKLQEVSTLLANITQELKQLPLDNPDTVQFITDTSRACQIASVPLDEIKSENTATVVTHSSSASSIKFAI